MAEFKHVRTDLEALIRNLDARCRARAAGLPDEATPPDSWAAVLFRVREQSFVSPLEQMAEVLDLPQEITRVPGTKPWLLGVANNRGTLLPIYDLETLLEGGQPRTRRRLPGGERRPEMARRRQRVLVVRQEELPCGLVVSEALGMRYVKNSDRLDEIPESLGPSRIYVAASYRIDAEVVPLIQLNQLIADPIFNAAMT